MPAGVSIVICCYNSAARLPETLRHIAALDALINGALETVIVDNCSTDGTAETATELWRGLNSPHELRVVAETSPGLSNARIKGFRTARHEIIVFCDDDNWLCPLYARTAREIFDGNPRIALAGGMTEGVFEGASVPPWFSQIAGAYAVGGTEGSCEVALGNTVWGAGMVARKEALLRLFDSGFTFLCSDRRGFSLTCGGDAELCHALQWLGYVVYHDGRLKLKHWIPKERLTWNYAVRLGKGWGAATIAGDAVRLVEHRQQPIRNAIRKSFLYHVVRGSLSLVPRLKQLRALPTDEGNTAALAAASKLGRLQAIASLRFSYANLVTEKAHWLERTAPQFGTTTGRSA